MKFNIRKINIVNIGVIGVTEMEIYYWMIARSCTIPKKRLIKSAVFTIDVIVVRYKKYINGCELPNYLNQQLFHLFFYKKNTLKQLQSASQQQLCCFSWYDNLTLSYMKVCNLIITA